VDLARCEPPRVAANEVAVDGQDPDVMPSSGLGGRQVLHVSLDATLKWVVSLGDMQNAELA
jgi:hypothetical protein